jgi:hypothetical protein
VYPIATFIERPKYSNFGAYNIGGINASGQVPTLTGNRGLIDADTPKESYVRTSWADGKTRLRLVFSDEFNQDGRTFYPGDDPYWQAENYHYWVCAFSYHFFTSTIESFFLSRRLTIWNGMIQKP